MDTHDQLIYYVLYDQLCTIPGCPLQTDPFTSEHTLHNQQCLNGYYPAGT